MYPNLDKSFLDFTTPFELLVATVLSAQCTDVRVNKVT
ncbi:MAG: endonuclease III, partial [Anaerococcus sp.]|nr:endonuclease III [Anaerococcus sp.]